jgi:hypothetical protein
MAWIGKVSHSLGGPGPSMTVGLLAEHLHQLCLRLFIDVSCEELAVCTGSARCRPRRSTCGNHVSGGGALLELACCTTDNLALCRDARAEPLRSSPHRRRHQLWALPNWRRLVLQRAYACSNRRSRDTRLIRSRSRTMAISSLARSAPSTGAIRSSALASISFASIGLAAVPRTTRV